MAINIQYSTNLKFPEH